MNLWKIIIYALIILALIGILGFIIYFTGGFTTDFTGFYAVVDGEDVLSTGSNFQTSHDDSMHVDVKYVFASPKDEAKGYSVKVVPNPIKDKDFDFRLNGDLYSFQAENDLTAGFEIKQEEIYTSADLLFRHILKERLIVPVQHLPNGLVVPLTAEGLLDLLIRLCFKQRRSATVRREYGGYVEVLPCEYLTVAPEPLPKLLILHRLG